MFISFSKTIARFGGFRLGIGIRLNRKNAMWAWMILFFVGLFQLMWGMMIICGWMIYAMFYGMYWCSKKIIGALLRKRRIKRVQNTMKNQCSEKMGKYTTMTSKMNNLPNKNQSPKKKSTIIRWIVGISFAMFALVNGFHFSSLFLLCAALLMLPLSFIDTFLQTKNIKPIVAIILSVALFFAGVLTSPPSEPTSSLDDTTQTTSSQNEDRNNNFSKLDSSTTKPDSPITNNTTAPPNNSTTIPDNSATNNTPTPTPDNTTNNDEKVEMVWITSSGKKYHSNSSCSGMKYASQVSLEDAKNSGYTACKKCH